MPDNSSPRSRRDEPDRPAIVLFRHDLRVSDNRALAAAAATGKSILPVFILDEYAGRALGAARRWWLRHSLEELASSLSLLGAPLVLRRGPTAAVVAELVHATGADLILWNRRYEPAALETDRALAAWAATAGIGAENFDGQLLYEPWMVKTKTGGPFSVFSAFWRAACAGAEPRTPVDASQSLRPVETPAAGDNLHDWRLLPTSPDWADGMRANWQPGERAAQDLLDRFIDTTLNGYAEGRDRLDRQATSRLSPHLVHGEITPFQIAHALRETAAPGVDRAKFLAELGWREFSWHLLFHKGDLAVRSCDQDFDGLHWRNDPDGLEAWRRGRTGYPLVDAGMRELWRTGWMHNRARMVAASFLTKHLLVDWREGERWFWDTLVDADPASNPVSWQWVTGCGADAAPFFRVFNPVLQAEKFDPEAIYVRRFLMEHEHIAQVVDHAFARRRALDAYASMKGNQ